MFRCGGFGSLAKSGSSPFFTWHVGALQLGFMAGTRNTGTVCFAHGTRGSHSCSGSMFSTTASWWILKKQSLQFFKTQSYTRLDDNSTSARCWASCTIVTLLSYLETSGYSSYNTTTNNKVNIKLRCLQPLVYLSDTPYSIANTLITYTRGETAPHAIHYGFIHSNTHYFSPYKSVVSFWIEFSIYKRIFVCFTQQGYTTVSLPYPVTEIAK